ncbi:hypothetical protein RCO28_07950 [Streptomyces sp. LHD-70]|uniref:hypothetical protein n=1 Tax=Streptomyces sp. LHD-70 TaxID=3072140 RepID=UPI0028100AB7|nr:hypothetical protein [Streptomyces sp. LHD-70]MDQ8702428.1 hypothetical protein [Streptomyces sp. LHD-70]
MSGFSDVSEPSSHLTAPNESPEEFSQGVLVDIFNDLGDLMSPTWYVTEAINLVFGFNPLEEVIDWYSGDWETFLRCGEVWTNVGKACDAVSANVKSGNTALDGTWNGNAADAAYVYFEELAKKLGEQKATLDQLQEAYQHMAHSAYLSAEGVKGILSGIIDGLLIVGLEIAAGTALSWTGVGAVVGCGLAALEIANILRQWSTATEAITQAQQLAQLTASAVENLANDLGNSFKNFPTPGSAYDHPNKAIA